MKYFSLLFIGLFFYACSDFTKGNQLKELDRMQQTIDSIETVLIENKYEEVDRFYKDALIVEKRIKENYSSDTISIEFAKQLDSYKSNMDLTPQLKKSYVKLLKELDVERNNLTNLMDDISNSNGDRSAYEDYILKEKNDVSTMRNNLRKYVENRKQIIEVYQQLHDTIYQFSFDLITD
jgi:DNA repair ATPase RecN